MSATTELPDLPASLGDRYRLVREIAKGGMGEVYLATDQKLNRSVAIKVMRSERASISGHERFLREIAITGRLAHPNIVPVFDSGEAGSMLFYVMPFEEGESLRKKMDREVQLPLDEALRITACIANAIGYAHGQGILHRDIKPENVILNGDQALVTDFGIAKSLTGSDVHPLTRDQTTVGTIAYMSPEQASASKTIDARSDLYSLALLLYEMLAGELPFRAPTPESMFARKAIGRYPPLRDIRPTLPEHIETAVKRALQPVAADRFKSVDDFARALRPAATGERGFRPGGTRLIAAGIGVALLLGAGAFFFRQSLFGSHSSDALGRVVVAPFDNKTGVQSIDVVGVMASDWITEGLQKTGIVDVVPTTTSVSATRYVRTQSEITTLGLSRLLAAETGGSTVVTGVIYRQADSLLFRASVSDRDGTHLIATITDISSPISNPMKGVEEVRARVMGWLSARYDDRLQPPSLASDRAPTYEAYRIFSEGMTDYIDVANGKALTQFLQAYSLDSTFTVALLYASIAASNLGQFSRADSLLQRVNSRRDDLSGFHRAWLDYRLAFVRGNRDAALTAIRIADRDAPQSKASYNHALEAFYSRYFSEALAAIKSISPDHGAMRGFAPYWEFYGTILHSLGRYNEELDIGKKSRALYPDRLTSLRSVSRALAALGDIDSLSVITDQARGMPVDPVGWDYGHTLNEVAEELDAHGHHAEARLYFAKLERWLQERPANSANAGPRHVRSLLALGNLDKAEREAKLLVRSDSTNAEYVGLSGLVFSREGKRDEASSAVQLLTSMQQPYQFGVTSLYRARILSRLGDQAGAMSALEKAFVEGKSYDLSLHRDPDLVALRAYSPFQQLIKGR